MAQNSTISGIWVRKIPKIENFGAEVRKKENPEAGSERGHRKRINTEYTEERRSCTEKRFLGRGKLTTPSLAKVEQRKEGRVGMLLAFALKKDKFFLCGPSLSPRFFLHT